MADRWIQDCQNWLDTQFYGASGYVATPQDGRTGWPTMYSLTRALQISLSIATPSSTFGPGTASAFDSQIGTLNPSVATTHPRIVGILRTALWCKGYSGGYNAIPGTATFTQWDAELDTSIAQLRSDLGLAAAGGVNSKLMKSLLSMDAYKTVSGGTAPVRAAQQWLNGRYFTRRDFPMVPCDGIFSRQVQTGLMYAVQYEIGMADGVANGNFGSGTQQGLRTYGNIASGTVEGSRKMVSLFQSALIFNGYINTPFTGAFTTATISQMQTFQAFAELGVTTGANYTTWASLLSSAGDPDRPVSAADTRTPATPARAATLAGNGHVVVGRYINGTGGKRIGHDEPGVLAAAGVRWFPIYQEWNDGPQHFSYEQGYTQGLRLAARARALGLPANTMIFLSVDFDATGDQISSIVMPHFQGAKDAVDGSVSLPLRLGVYGTRNVCRRLGAAGLTAGSFVADMSSGWSGNLGFRLPDDWMYDQIKTVQIGAGDGAIEIDRVARSSRSSSLSPSDMTPTPRTYNGAAVTGYSEAGWWRWAELSYLAEARLHAAGHVTRDLIAELVLTRIQQPTYWSTPEGGTLGLIWATFYTPQYESFHADSIHAPAVAIARGGFNRRLDEGIFLEPEGYNGAFGDVSHMAAVCRAHLHWGVAQSSGALLLEDFSSWAGDLATLWRDYEVTRAGGTLDVYTWFRANLGGAAESNSFDINDMRSDLAGYVVAYDHRFGRPNDSLSEIIRRLLLSIAADPRTLPKRWFALRWGNSRVRIESAVVALFGPDAWPWPDAPREMLTDGVRLPGRLDDSGTGSPPPAVRASEITEVARALADYIEWACQNWTSRS